MCTRKKLHGFQLFYVKINLSFNSIGHEFCDLHVCKFIELLKESYLLTPRFLPGIQERISTTKLLHVHCVRGKRNSLWLGGEGSSSSSTQRLIQDSDPQWNITSSPRLLVPLCPHAPGQVTHSSSFVAFSIIQMMSISKFTPPTQLCFCMPNEIKYFHLDGSQTLPA